MPLTAYFMPHAAEIALARSAAPKSISAHASVMVLTAHGYVTAVKGSNGFTCLVSHGWDAPVDFPEFWNPKLRGPLCYNPEASRSVLSYDIERAKLVAAGLSRAQIYARVAALVAKHELPDPANGSISYMMSKQQYLNDEAGNWYPHIMLHLTRAAGANGGANLGANLPGSPIFFDSSDTRMPENESIFYIPVRWWSDGSPAPKMKP
jgi:hypothetical protein